MKNALYNIVNRRKNEFYGKSIKQPADVLAYIIDLYNIAQAVDILYQFKLINKNVHENVMFNITSMEMGVLSWVSKGGLKK